MKIKPYVTAVITAAGNSSRMNINCSKQTLIINGISVIAGSIRAFENSNLIDEIIVVCRDSERKFIENEIKRYNFKKVSRLVEGGNTRQQSVSNGVISASEKTNFFAIHDGARCFVDTSDIDRAINGAFTHKAVALAVPVRDTVKSVDNSNCITATLNRDKLRLVQTPQIFEKEIYFKALSYAKENNSDYTDDCQLMENIGVTVKLIDGSPSNIKLTVQEDLNGMNTKTNNFYIRVGHGYDVHKFSKNRKLILGGVEIPYSMGLLGHSDADVLLHSIMDALLGATALGDIGKLFPDNDNTYKNADSLKLLQAVYTKIIRKGYSIVNIDVTVIAQEPKLSAYIDKMRATIAQALCLDIDTISIKATTEEGLGFSGRKEGIASHCVCSVNKHN